MAGPRACYQYIYDYHLDNVKKNKRLIAKNSNSRWLIPNQVQVNHESNSEILQMMVTRNGSWKNKKIDLEFSKDQECLWHHWKDKIRMKLERIWATEAELKRNKVDIARQLVLHWIVLWSIWLSTLYLILYTI